MVNRVMNLTGTARWNFKQSEQRKQNRKGQGFAKVLEGEKRRAQNDKVLQMQQENRGRREDGGIESD